MSIYHFLVIESFSRKFHRSFSSAGKHFLLRQEAVFISICFSFQDVLAHHQTGIQTDTSIIYLVDVYLYLVLPPASASPAPTRVGLMRITCGSTAASV